MDVISDIFEHLNQNNTDLVFEIFNSKKDQIEKFGLNKVNIDNKSIINAISVFHGHTFENEFWKSIICILDIVCIPNELISYLLDNKLAKLELSHLDIDDKWLFILGKEYFEPLQTLIVRYFTEGNRYYKSKSATPSEFEKILNKIGRNEYLIDWTISGYIIPDDIEKIEILYNYNKENYHDKKMLAKAENYYLMIIS